MEPKLPKAESFFSWNRVGLLFVILVISGAPIAASKYLPWSAKQSQDERAKQEQLDREVEKIRLAAERREAGEAFRRFFGVPEAVPKK